MRYSVWQYVTGTRSKYVEIPDEEVEGLTDEELDEEIWRRSDLQEWTGWVTDDWHDSGWDEE